MDLRECLKEYVRDFLEYYNGGLNSVQDPSDEVLTQVAEALLADDYLWDVIDGEVRDECYNKGLIKDE